MAAVRGQASAWPGFAWFTGFSPRVPLPPSPREKVEMVDLDNEL